MDNMPQRLLSSSHHCLALGAICPGQQAGWCGWEHPCLSWASILQRWEDAAMSQPCRQPGLAEPPHLFGARPGHAILYRNYSSGWRADHTHVLLQKGGSPTCTTSKPLQRASSFPRHVVPLHRGTAEGPSAAEGWDRE